MIVVVSGCTRALRDDGEGATVNRQPAAHHLVLPEAASGARGGRFGGSAAALSTLAGSPPPLLAVEVRHLRRRITVAGSRPGGHRRFDAREVIGR